MLIVLGCLCAAIGGPGFLLACLIQLRLVFATGFVAYWITKVIGGWLGREIAWWFVYLVALLILSPPSYAIIRKL